MKGLQDLLEESSRLTPDHPAIEDPANDQNISYRKLNELVSSLSSRLKDEGVGSHDRVAICADKSIVCIASIFAVLKAGAAYVPLDPDSPSARNAGIVQDVACALLLVDPSAAESLGKKLGWKCLAALPEPWFAGWVLMKPPVSQAAGEAGTAYILYTSGSTGEPKGVVHSHASALAFIGWCSEIFKVTSSDRVLSVAPFHFDLSVFDLFVTLKHGACLVLAGGDARLHPRGLASLAASQKISIWYTTPTILRLLLGHGELEQESWPSLRLVLFAGEVLDPEDLEKLRQVWKRADTYNLYGPTETNVCTFFDATRHVSSEGPIPIGQPCPYDKLRLNSDGEILVSGTSVMRGYWGKKDEKKDGWYHTGDHAEERADGLWIFKGRLDRMVKRRGYRVELGAIETTLRSHPAVTEAAVISLPDRQSGVLIRAHVSCSAKQAPSVLQIKDFLGEKLPAYMLPDSIRFDVSLPKLASGKIDYRLLGGLS